MSPFYYEKEGSFNQVAEAVRVQVGKNPADFALIIPTSNPDQVEVYKEGDLLAKIGEDLVSPGHFLAIPGSNKPVTLVTRQNIYLEKVSTGEREVVIFSARPIGKNPYAGGGPRSA